MKDVLQKLELEEHNSGVYSDRWTSPKGPTITSQSPITGNPIANVTTAGEADYDAVVETSLAAFDTWRRWPAPRRGEVIRQFGQALRENRDELGKLVTLEMGKILAEGVGEVQEMIDICDFAVGLSRQLYGLSMHSERPDHRMYEQWHPIGPIGVISAFNFPVAVWSWNAAIAAICGNSVIWKPSPKTPLTAIAVQKIAERVLRACDAPPIFQLVIGDAEPTGRQLVNDHRIPLISATGSCRMGKAVAAQVGARLGRSLLELGGNNAIIVTDDADLDLTVRGVLFGAVGTAGQRCTTTRRLLMQKTVSKELTRRLVSAYEQVVVGDPMNPETLMGPLIDDDAVQQYQHAVDVAKKQGGTILCGGNTIDSGSGGHYVTPTIIQATVEMPIVKQETFAPILYLLEGETIEELIAIQNAVPQGLSSAMFTNNLRHAERFLSSRGSDCGIANINIGTSGAEIGGAFGGEKETGGGREAGSDAWKAYMRRQTVTINYGTDLPLAQGITFGD